MDLTPYLPFAVPAIGVILAAAAFRFNVKNARKQKEKAEEEQPRRVFLGVKHSPPETPTGSTYYIHNGSDFPIYRLVLHWKGSGPRPNNVTTIRMIEPGGRYNLKGQEYIPPSRISAEFDDSHRNRWCIDDAGHLYRLSKGASSSDDYDRLTKQD